MYPDSAQAECAEFGEEGERKREAVLAFCMGLSVLETSNALKFLTYLRAVLAQSGHVSCD